MDYKMYSEELEKIIGAITLPDHTRITVDAFVKQARKKAEGGQDAGTNPHWIPVEERLPKFDEQVLVYGLCPNGCRLFYVDCLIQDINDNGYPKWDDDTIIPTHWMEIVPPRKEEE